MPVYSGSLDNITGIAFAHDLLQITDEEARTRTVASIQRPAAFVPETKRGYELLREMQREKQHMRIVIDEYGGGGRAGDDRGFAGADRRQHPRRARRRYARLKSRSASLGLVAGAGQISRRSARRSVRRAGGVGRGL